MVPRTDGHHHTVLISDSLHDCQSFVTATARNWRESAGAATSVRTTRTQVLTSMNSLLTRFFQLLMVGCFVAAVCEVNWVLVLAVFATSFLGLLTVGIIQGQSDNQDYEAAVLEFRSPSDPVKRLPLFRPVWSLLFLVAFATLTGTAIWLDNPWIAFAPFFVLMTFATVTVLRGQQRRLHVWEQFAAENGLEFHPGNRWNPRDTPSVSGSWNDCRMSLGTAWQSNPHSRSSSETLIGTADTNSASEDFCVDDLAVEQSTSDIVAQLFQRQDLARRLRAAQPKRIALFEGQVSLHAPRVPGTAVELRFYAELLKDLSREVSRIVAAG